MTSLDLIMPMAGRGSRFATMGIDEPKPLIDLNGRPFFWWAVESIRRTVPVQSMVFVVLQQHILEWSISERILEYYPAAGIVSIPDVTSGAAETAYLGAKALTGSNPIAINDCDHAFVATGLAAALNGSQLNSPAGTLMTFRSDSPNYSYVQLSATGAVTGTVEKRAVSPFAIAGCYLFRDNELFLKYYAEYVRNCTYSELFLSGLYNEMLGAGEIVGKFVLDEHFAFGTPDEYNAVKARIADRLSTWTQTG